MNMVKIVYNSIFGFGTIQSRQGYYAKVNFFGSKKIVSINKSQLIQVDDDLVNFIVEGEYKNYFQDSFLQRGYDYYKDDKVKEIKYDDRVIEAIVKGNNEYEVTIKFQPSGMTSKCTCPVSRSCKHVAAVCYKLENIFNSLNENGASRKPAKLSDDILAAYSELKDRINIYENAQIIVDDLAKNDNEYFKTFYKQIDDKITYDNNYRYRSRYSYYDYNYNSNNTKNYPVILLAYNNVLRMKIYDIRKNNDRSFAYEIDDYIDKAEVLSNKYVSRNYYKFSNNSKIIPELFLVFNKYYFDYINFSLSSTHNVPYETKIFNYCASKIKYSEELHRTIESSMLVNKGAGIDYRVVLSKFPSDKRLEFYLNDHYDFTFYYGDIKNYDYDIKKRLLHKCRYSENEVEDVLNNEIDLKNDDIKDVLKIIARINKYVSKNKHLINFLKKIPNSEYYIDYLTGDNGTYYRHIWYDDTYYLDNINTDYKNVNELSLTNFFDVDFDVKEADESYSISYYAKDVNDEIVILVEENSDGLLLLKNMFSSDPSHILPSYLVYYIRENKKEKLQKAINKANNNIQKRKQKRLCEAAQIKMDLIGDRSIINRLKVRNDFKAKLEYAFLFQNSRLFLRLKIGIEKMYVVKNVVEFIENFNKQNTVQYGKNFQITHTLDNFNDRDGKIISTLLKSNPVDYYEKKYFSLNQFLAIDLFDKLKDSYITYNDVSYYVRLNDVKCNMGVNNDYCLQFSLEGVGKYDLLCLDNDIYIFDLDNKYIDVYRCNKEEKNLFMFYYEFNGLYIKDILEDYKKNIYTHYYNNIEIAEEIKDDFKLSIVNIKAYFDYEDRAISVRKEYYKDDKLIDINKIKDNNDLLRIEVFDRFLTGLGFEDDVLSDDGKVLAFFYMDLSELKKYCEVYLSESVENKQISPFKTSAIRITYDGVIMKSFLEDSNYSDEELSEIMRAIKKKKKYVLLSNNHIIDINNKESEDFYDTVNDLALDQKHLNKEAEISLSKALKALAHENNCELDDYLSSMIDEIRNFKDSKIALPKINGELREYQKDGYRWLSILSKYNVGGILADDMGLGKTIEIIALLCASNVKKPSLIVCPKTVVFNWKNEINRFAPELEIIEIYGLKEQRDEIISNIKNNKKVIYISSYDSLRNDLSSYKASFEYVVIDEAQYIKNVNALKTKSVKKLKASHKFALTGTPIENNIIDLWSIFDFIMPGYFDDLSTFKSNYSDNDNYVDVVRKRIAPFILRRTKENVLKDLPEKYERIMTVEMQSDQRKIYDAFKKEVNDKLESGSKAFDVLPYLTRLRQICVNPNMFIDKYDGSIAKNDLLSDILDEYIENGHKLLIFSQFVKALNGVEKMLKDKGIPYYMITGATDAKKRIDIANKFNNDSEEKVVLISLKAGGTGMNLIGADTVIHLDPWWNVASENQASDRSHRIGQTHNVEVIKIICEKSIEQRVIELQNIKKDLIDKLIAKDEKSLTGITLEDLRFILD